VKCAAPWVTERPDAPSCLRGRSVTHQMRSGSLFATVHSGARYVKYYYGQESYP
jgi:hypothetical protein